MSQASRERERDRAEKYGRERKEKKEQIILRDDTPEFIDITPKIGIDQRFSLILKEFLKESGMNGLLLSVEAFRKVGAKFITLCENSQGKGIAFYENSTDKKPLGVCIAQPRLGV